MWFDVLKNQISVGRQKLRSSKKPLPDEDNDEDCRTKFKRLVQSLESSSKVRVTNKRIMPKIDELPDRFFCEAIEQLIAYVDEYKTIEDIPLSRYHPSDYIDGFYTKEFFKEKNSSVNNGIIVVTKYHPEDPNRMEGKLNTFRLYLHFTIKIYPRVLSLDFQIDAYKVLSTDDEPEIILEDKYQELRTIIMRYS